MKKLLLIAYNIHQGGGKVLLESLVSKLLLSYELTILIDERNISKFPNECNIIVIKPKIFDRLKAEFLIFQTQFNFNEALFFGNLPPLLNISIPTKIYLQNKFLLESNSYDLSKTAIRLALEKIWLKMRLKQCYRVEVQGESMKSTFLKVFPKHKNISINFFYKKRQSLEESPLTKHGFFYPANFLTHKNHARLIEAWLLLSKKGLFPELYLTISRNEFKRKHLILFEHISKLKIFFEGNLEENNLIYRYQATKTLVYPSLLESMGLPLIEARDFGLDIICSELDYVHDHIVPTLTFDPLSSISIAATIEKYLRG